jgi:hypothetical protein
MTEKELLAGLLPALIARIDDPFKPSDEAAKRCLDAAIGWAKALARVYTSDPNESPVS